MTLRQAIYLVACAVAGGYVGAKIEQKGLGR